MRRRAEVLESFRQEGTREEQAYLLPDGRGFVLVHITDADDSDRANAAYETSSLPIDIEHHAMLSECLRNACNCAQLPLHGGGRLKREGAAIMVIRVVRLGSPRAAQEASGSAPCGARRAAPKSRVRATGLVRPLVPQPRAQRGDDEARPAGHHAGRWAAFVRKYRAEMATPENSHSIALLAALSHQTSFSVGCCEHGRTATARCCASCSPHQDAHRARGRVTRAPGAIVAACLPGVQHDTAKPAHRALVLRRRPGLVAPVVDHRPAFLRGTPRNCRRRAMRCASAAGSSSSAGRV